MPSSSLTAAIEEAYATAKSDVIYLDTLEISNSATETLYLVRDRVDHTLRLETGEQKLFVATGFRFVLPAAGENGIQELSIAVDNVDRRPSDFVQAVLASQNLVQVKYRPYLASDPETPQMNPPLILFLTDIVISPYEVTGKATFADILNRKFLSENYTRRRFPAL